MRSANEEKEKIISMDKRKICQTIRDELTYLIVSLQLMEKTSASPKFFFSELKFMEFELDLLKQKIHKFIKNIRTDHD